MTINQVMDAVESKDIPLHKAGGVFASAGKAGDCCGNRTFCVWQMRLPLSILVRAKKSDCDAVGSAPLT
jgi:hypothetical protein